MTEEIKTTEMQEKLPLEEIPTAIGEIVETEDDDIDALMPSMNINAGETDASQR